MPHHGRLKLVVDTNIWISYLLTGSFATLVNGWRTERFILLYSEDLLTEIMDVLSRPHLRKRIPVGVAEALVNSIRHNATAVEVTSVVDACRDAKDNYLLSLAMDGHADILVTGDDDLQVLHSFAQAIILSPAEFTAAFK